MNRMPVAAISSIAGVLQIGAPLQPSESKRCWSVRRKRILGCRAIFNFTLRFGQMGLDIDVPFRRAALHYITGYGFLKTEDLLVTVEARLPRPDREESNP